MSQPVNRMCPYCGNNDIAAVTYTDPINFNYTETTKYICTKCGNEIDFNNLPEEVQLSKDEIEMSKKIFEGKLHIPCDNVWGVGYAYGSLEPEKQTLTITNCEKIKMYQKKMDIDFEFDTKKIDNIDAIIINGHKFVREK